jgi:Cysteine protease
MKRIKIAVNKILVVLSAAAMLSVSACGSEDTNVSESGTAVETAAVTEEITEAVTEEEIVIPEKYSLLDEGKVTEYKNQHQSGMCWAYAAASVAESSLIVSGYEDNSVDLSEGHICSSVYRFAEDRPADSQEDGVYVLGDKKKNKTIPYYVGGSSSLVVNQFAIGAGPIYEQEAPINTDAGQLEKSVDNIFKLEEEGKLTKYMGKYLLTHSIMYDNPKDIKAGIIKHGAVFVGMFADKKGIGKDSEGQNNYYLTDRKNPPKDTNHVVTIIGWDDNYSKDSFTNTPPGDGAWLIKDSVANSGYFWMSYDEFYDESYVQGMVFSNRADYGDILFYDSLIPMCGIKADGEYTEIANVFKADKDNEIKGVGIYTNAPDQKVNVSIYRNPEAGKPDSGEKIYEKEYVIEYKGYEVVNVDTTAAVSAGDSFSIVLKYTNSNTSDVAPFEGDKSMYITTSWAEIYIVSNEGESYAKSGDTWYDTSKSETAAVFGKPCTLNNACIKVLMR